MDFEEDTYSRIFIALKHPVRRKILRMLNEKRCTYTEILNNLGVGTGFLNYHLENMSELISKDNDGRYFVSSFGEAALSLLSGVESPVTIKPRAVTILGKKINPTLISLVIITAVILLNAYLVYGYQNISREKANTFGEILIQSRGLLLESINILNSTIEESRIDIVLQDTLRKDLLLLSQNYKLIMSLDYNHREYWSQVKESTDSLIELFEDLDDNIRARIIVGEIKDINLINTGYTHNLYFGKIRDNLMEIERHGFPNNIVVGNNPRFEIIDSEIIKAVDASIKMRSNIDLTRSAFNLGRKFYSPK